ncbi:MAG: class I SAM-dependent methyltransferase [Candidatus Lokiarchaeota archaeon]|nr:class I SAM-dependent methyltransferase [Candidatus Lokiarchaeota archaeon]
MAEEKMFFIDPHLIDLTNVELNGRILDVGGGGEGIIGLYKGTQVIAIDRRKNELEEAADGDYLKIIMDAKDLQFLDETFETATAFYLFMYVPMENRREIFEEIYRVLKKGGELVLWDMVILKKGESNKELYGAEVKVKIGDKEIDTGYGTHWNKEQDLKYFIDLGKAVGFNISSKQEIDKKIYIRFQKPN